jgi:hypothetical protein
MNTTHVTKTLYGQSQAAAWFTEMEARAEEKVPGIEVPEQPETVADAVRREYGEGPEEGWLIGVNYFTEMESDSHS